MKKLLLICLVLMGCTREPLLKENHCYQQLDNKFKVVQIGNESITAFILVSIFPFNDVVLPMPGKITKKELFKEKITEIECPKELQ